MPHSDRPSSLAASFQVALPLVILALGHTLSNLLRTLPAVSADLISADLGIDTGLLGVLTGAYHLFFALGQIPAGVMLDRLGVKTVSLSLFVVAAMGAMVVSIARGPYLFVAGQALLGIGCCGMLLCPITLAAKTLPPARFALWSGLILSIGNSGMLLSATPMAWLIEHHGWRASFWVSAALAILIGGLVAMIVPGRDKTPVSSVLSLKSEFREVLSLAVSPGLRGPVLLAFTSLAAVLAVRGVWGGPWFMEVKGLSRIDAGNALLPLTLAMAVCPVLAGAIDRMTGARRTLLAGGHLLAGLMLVVIAATAPGGWLSVGFLGAPAFDAWVLFAFGCCISTQPLLFAMGQASTSKAAAGKALAALNLMFFCGTAFHQLASGWIASKLGLAAVFIYIAAALGVSTLLFLRYTRRR